MAVVAHAPAPIRPMASATLLLQELTCVGDIPTEVCPYIWVVWTPVRAVRRALPARDARCLVALMRLLLLLGGPSMGSGCIYPYANTLFASMHRYVVLFSHP